MKVIFLAAILLISQRAVQAQDSWKIKWNNRTILLANKEDEAVNIRHIKLSDWKKNGALEIIYKEEEPDTVLWHSFVLFDEEDHQLLSKEKILYAKIPLSLLRKLFTGKKQIKIYSIVSPRNPNIAVKMRRVHLCTLQLP